MKKIFFPIDAVIFLVLYCALALWLAVVTVYSAFNPRKKKIGKKMLELAHYNINDIEREGLSHPVFEYDLGGYFENIVTVIFSTTDTKESDKIYKPFHRIISVPQQPEGILRRLGFSKTNFALSVIRLLSKCVKAAKEEKATFFRAQDPHMLGLAAFLCSAIAGIPYTIHVLQNYDISTRRVQRIVFPPFIFRSVENGIERMILKNALFVTAGCANYKFYALSHGAMPESVFSSRMPAGKAHLKEPALRKDLKGELGLSGKRVILYVGRLEKVKFVEDLILCFKEVAVLADDARLVIAGMGSLGEDLKAMARRSGLENKTLFLGKVSRDRLVDLYYTADVILFTHAGVTIVEALLAEKPVVAYDHDWAGEVTGYNERGLLAQFRDFRALARCVTEILNDKERAASLGSAGRKFALSYFTRDVISGIERAAFERFE
ncbi:MAG: glycosyltransferase [Candidatus Omnitrophota bacterium]|nr:glycosyltransferase [Candidatus Omnitrophota bacterium]